VAIRRLIWGSLLAALAATPAAAVQVTGTRAQLQWTSASGPVAGYAVFVSLNNGPFQEIRRIAATTTAVDGAIGDSVRVRVAAHDSQGHLGPVSANSEPIEFVSSTEPPDPGSGPAADLDGDGRADTLLFRARSGELHALLLQADGTRVPVLIGTQDDLALQPAAYADVDGDGMVDVLWRDPESGANELWLLHDMTFTEVALPARDPAFEVAALRDFGADGRADLLWHDPATGQSTLWWLDGSGVQGEQALDPAPPGRALAAVLDFDGDGYPDLAWKDSESGDVECWQMSGATVTALVGLGSIEPADAEAAAGDLDADGDDDLVWDGRRGKKRILVAWFLEGVENPSAGLAMRGAASRRLVGLLDVDSDGRADLVTRKKSQARQSFKAYAVLPTGELDDEGAMHWDLEPVPLDSVPGSKAWSFLTTD
jgi:hypothetical protein